MLQLSPTSSKVFSRHLFRRQPFRPVLHLLILLLAGIGADAQVDRSGLNGTVKDPDGRLLQGAHVMAVQNSTGLQRSAMTSAHGTYELAELPVGIYTVTFTHEGFQEKVLENVVQGIGQTRTLDAVLQVSGKSQQVDVSANTLFLDETSATVGTRIERTQIWELPLNGRNWATLTALAPMAVDNGGSNQRSIRFAGRGRDDNNFTYDGIDETNIINQGQQTYVRLSIPTDANH